MNKRLICFFILIFPFSFSCISETLTTTYYSEDTTIELKDGVCKLISVNFETDEIVEKIFDYTLSYDDYGNSIAVDQNDNCYRYFKFGDYLLIYGRSNVPLFIGNSVTSRRLESFVYPERILASSSLVEGNRVFSPENLYRIGNLNYTWSEGVPGNGVGEKISLKVNHVENIYILPGYVSIDRPDLFKKNNRPKSVRLTYGSESLNVKFDDYPKYKQINLGSEFSGEIQIEIIDVYPGTKYDDTCISSILCCY